MGLWIRWELRTWFERGAKRGCFGHLLYTVKCGPDLWRSIYDYAVTLAL